MGKLRNPVFGNIMQYLVYIDVKKSFNQIWNRVFSFLLLAFSLEHEGHPDRKYPLIIKIDQRVGHLGWCFSISQWIGLRENLQETMAMFPLFLWGFPIIFPINHSIELGSKDYTVDVENKVTMVSSGTTESRLIEDTMRKVTSDKWAMAKIPWTKKRP